MARGNRDKAAFCRSLDWRIPIDWFDRTGIHRLDGERIAKIELDSHGVHDHYPGFRATVFNKREGKVDSKYFLFQDYLDGSREGRKDSRGDMPDQRYEVIGYCGFHWYVAVPKDTRPFCAAVEAWLEAFR